MKIVMFILLISAQAFTCQKKNLEQKFICELIEAASILLHQNNNILNITSVINDAHVRRIKLILEDAKQKGGEVIELLKPNQFEK